MPRLVGQIDLAKTEAILDAASEVLGERGLAAPMEAIARRAGVSKQTVYNHYGSKAELIRALVDRRVVRPGRCSRPVPCVPAPSWPPSWKWRPAPAA
jgi:TetR/AcrR family transcriptional repressor of mexJK operon